MHEAIQKYISNCNDLIHRFISNFVDLVNKKRIEILIKNPEKLIRNVENYVCCYCDIIKESILAGSMARVLGVFPYTSGNEFRESVSELKFVGVEKTVIRNISILLADEYGNQLNLSPSLAPTFICLTFKKNF